MIVCFNFFVGCFVGVNVLSNIGILFIDLYDYFVFVCIDVDVSGGVVNFVNYIVNDFFVVDVCGGWDFFCDYC